MRSALADSQKGQTILEYCLLAAVLLFATILFWNDIGTKVRISLERGLQRTIQQMVPTHG